MAATHIDEKQTPPEELQAKTEQKLEIEDGLVIDATTGEIVSDELPDDLIDEAGKDGDHVSAAFIDYQLKRIQTADATCKTLGSLMAELKEEREARVAAIAAEDPRCAVLNLRIANIEGQIKGAGARGQWLRDAYGVILQRFAAFVTSGGRSRTYKSKNGYGSISLKSVPARVKIADPAAALVKAKELGWPVKEEFQISALPQDMESALLANPESASEFGLTVEPASEKVTVKG